MDIAVLSQEDGPVSTPEYQKAFGRRLKQARIKAGFSTATAFARALDIDHFRYRAWEEGRNAPSMEMLLEISRLTNKTLDQLMRPDAPKKIIE